MICLYKKNDQYYYSFSGDNFHKFVQVMNENYIYFDKNEKAYTDKSRYKIKNIISELKSIEDFYVSEETIIDLDSREFGEYETVFKRRRLKEELFKSPPLGEYQKEDVKKMIQQNRMLNANDTGIGKTYETIVGLNHFFDNNEIDKVFIISVPESLYNWKKELVEFGFFNEDEIEIIDKNKRSIEDFFNKKILIVSYRTFLLCSDFYYFKKTKKKSSSYKTKTIDFSLFGEKRCIVLDESHLAKNLDSRTNKVIKLHKEYFEFRYCLTATPYPNNFTEIYANLHFLDKGLVGDGKIDFDSYFGNLGNTYSDTTLDVDSINPEKVKEFTKTISSFYIRRFKKDVMPNMPDQYIKKIYVEMSKEHEKVYDSIIKYKLRKIIDDNGFLYTKEVYNNFPYLTLACSDPIAIKNIELGELNHWNPKYNNKFEIADSLLEKHNGEKIILWSVHPATIKILSERYKKYNPFVIDGTTNTCGLSKEEFKEREKNEFRNNADRNLAIFSPLCMGTSISIPESTVSICFDRDYSNTVWTQLLGRNYRITSKKDVIVYVLIYDNSLEVIQDEILDQKFNANKILLSQESVSDDVWNSIFKKKAKLAIDKKV